MKAFQFVIQAILGIDLMSRGGSFALISEDWDEVLYNNWKEEHIDN